MKKIKGNKVSKVIGQVKKVKPIKQAGKTVKINQICLILGLSAALFLAACGDSARNTPSHAVGTGEGSGIGTGEGGSVGTEEGNIDTGEGDDANTGAGGSAGTGEGNSGGGNVSQEEAEGEGAEHSANRADSVGGGSAEEAGNEGTGNLGQSGSTAEMEYSANRKVGGRLLSYWQNVIVGENEDGLITIVASAEELSEENQERIDGVISFGEDVLYLVSGMNREKENASYTEIRSVKLKDTVVSREEIAGADWISTGDALYFVYYDSYKQEYDYRYHFIRITEKEEGGYDSEPVYEELAQAAYDKRLKFLEARQVPSDIAKNGITYVTNVTKNKDGGNETDCLIKINEKGEESGTIELEQNMTYVRWRTDRGVIYQQSRYSEEESANEFKMFYLDFPSGRTVCLYDAQKDTQQPVYLASEGKRIYYYKSDESEFEHNIYQIYAYDVEEEKETFLYRASAVAGGDMSFITAFSYGIPGVSGFAAVRGECLFLMPDGKEVCWFRTNVDSGKAPEHTGIVVSEFSVLRYGEVSYVSKTVLTEETGKTAYQYYLEKLQLTTQDAGVEFINQTLAERFEKYLLIAEQQAEDAKQSAEEFEFWLSNPTTTDRVGRVREIGSGYYAIEFNGYEYWGGAHGYPYRNYYLFNRNTGEEVTIKDLYTGTEEEFKDMVARYTVEDWLRNPEQYFGWTDAKEAYENLYENASFDMLMSFQEEGLVICYAPYDLGSYAAGYIEVSIPYEELGIEWILN